MSLAILSKKDPAVSRLIKSSELLRAAKELGSGNFCKVFTSSKPTRVLKLTTDKTHYEYLIGRTAPASIFRPRVYKDFGKIGNTSNGVEIFLLEVERLRELRYPSQNYSIVAALTEFEISRNRLPELVSEIRGVSRQMLEFMKRLNAFKKSISAGYDIGDRNFMERRTGTLVFNDPLYDEALCDRYYWSGSGYNG